MDDDGVDAGQFEPIAQMRRLAIVLPKALEPVDRIPVKLCLPESLDPDLFSELLNDKGDSSSKHQSVKEQNDFPTKLKRNNPDNHETKEREEKEWERKELDQEELEKKELEKKELKKEEELDIRELEKKEGKKNAREKKELEKKGWEKEEELDMRELEKKEGKKHAREKKERENKEWERDEELDMSELEKKKGKRNTREKKERENKEWERDEELDIRELEKKEGKKHAREKKERENKEREHNAIEMKEHKHAETDKRDFVRRESHEKKDIIIRNRKDSNQSKKTYGKQNYWSESETSSLKSIDSQLNVRPGRNMRATPLSRASSRNTNYDDLHSEVNPDETFPLRARRVSTPTDSSDRSYRLTQKRVRDKELVGQLAEGRRREHRKEVHRYYVRSMINETYRRKRNGIAASSSDLDHPFPSRRRLPTEPRSQSTLSHHSLHSGNAPHGEPRHHRPHHRSKRSDAAAAAAHHHGDAGRRSADWVGSQQAGRRVQSAQPRVKGSDEVDNVVMIIREEFKRLGFL